ncbi:MAG: hypothetical protein ACLR5S_10770 [Ruminococcus sp.]
MRVEVPADKSHGDFAANVAMVSAKTFRMAPRKIAELLLDAVSLDGTIFDRAEIAGPGFMNFFLQQKWFADVTETVLTEKENYGRTQTGAGKRALVEFVSANPTGPMHVGKPEAAHWATAWQRFWLDRLGRTAGILRQRCRQPDRKVCHFSGSAVSQAL